MTEHVKEDTFKKLEQQINLAEVYIGKSLFLESNEVVGARKLTRKLKAELRFLNELKKGSMPMKQSHLNSTNLSHLGGIIDVIEDINHNDVYGVLKTITWLPDASTMVAKYSSLIIDVITSQTWLKVVARNPVALHKLWKGEGNFGDKSIEDQAKDCLQASKQHQINYNTPQIIFVFTQGVTETLAECLRELNVTVRGTVLPDPGCKTLQNPELPTIISKQSIASAATIQTCSKVNLDVTALIALVSALTNGCSHFIFEEQVLNDQAKSEQQSPVLPKLQAFLKDKDLFACSSAIASFKTILATLGGTREKERAEKLLSTITEIQDNPSSRIQNLKASAKVKARPKIVFGTGDKIQAITVSSNFSFVRAAKEQGVLLSVFLHEPRALTENKGKSTLLDDR